MLKIGEKAPDFELPNENGEIVRLSDFKGKNIILFFYPKDMSPGCTREACAFRDNYETLNTLDTIVIGINMDPPEKHRKFKGMHNLPFILLSDMDGEVIRKYRVGRWFGLLLNRVTYVIDKDGIIRYTYKSLLSPKSHVKKALEVLREIGDK